MRTRFSNLFSAQLLTQPTSLLATLLFSLATLSSAQANDLNEYVLQAVSEMPVGGSYSTAHPAGLGLIAAVKTQPELAIDTAPAHPSFCTSATYLVFLKALEHLRADGLFSVTASLLPFLSPPGSVDSLFNDDGKGIWGRWNANGPGTARLFHELGMGEIFVGCNKKRPGDFMKIHWNDFVGGTKERGHSVVYLGERLNPITQAPEVQYWSSNQANGYGTAWVARSRIIHAIFSRLQDPNALTHAPAIPETDDYLKGLLTNASTYAEEKEKSGVIDTE